MQVTFLAHSGFLVELDSVTLLFDWWQGELPPLPEKPLLVFASHRHEDHFNPQIFTLDDGRREVQFFLGSDIRLTPRNLEKWQISPETAERCRHLPKSETFSLPNLTVETLPSTDEGVAFLVTADNQTVFHAGDLHWWHWEGEDKAWNRNMEVNFKRYTEPLRNRHIDLTMLPIDPRQGEAGFWGAAYYLELADIRLCLPMHQWENFDFTKQFLTQYPQFRSRVLPVTRNGESFTIRKGEMI